MNKLTPIAHAVRFAMRCGIVCPKELAAELECSLSAVYRALKQLKGADRTVNVSDRTVKSDPAVSTVGSKSDAAVTPSRAQSYTEEVSNIINNNTTYPAPRNPSSDDVDDDDFKLEKQLRDAAVDQPINHFAASMCDVTQIRDLINQGYDLEGQILPTIRKHQHKGGQISSWGYFATIIKSKHAKPDQSGPKKVRYAQEEWEPGELVSSYVN